jgi:hypothetical protein
MLKLFFLLSFFSTSCVFGQIDLINKSATNSSIAILYIGAENIIQVKGNKGFSNYSLEVSGTNSKVEKLETDKYLVRVYRMDTCTITMKSNGKQLFSKQYKTETIPYPIAIAAATRDTIISKSKLLLNPFLTVILPDCYYADNRRVIGFQTAFISKGDSTHTTSPCYLFSEEQLKLTNQLKKGDKIWFDNIRASCSSGRTLALKPFAITIE